MNKAPEAAQRNNLSKSSSPYLLQHNGNPVWWQEWSSDIISLASQTGKPLFVSVGYSTCHWCHVMAAEAFSDRETAEFLNENFICIKVDREQRPDIDQFMMDFINRLTGRGGWPLNVFLTPDLHPVFAMTYAPAKETPTMNSFLSIVKKVLEVYNENRNSIPAFTAIEKEPSVIGESSLVRILSDYYDPYNGGFGNGHKFPPHSTLLFLLYQISVDPSPSIQTICTKTLDAMYMRGLNDHLQGGIFRYCVDNEWTIPHFEKMLYDQAMALWVFSLAYRVTGKTDYLTMSKKIIKCLDESFLEDGLFTSAHDADTDHKEGDTYLWTWDQLMEDLGEEDFSRFGSAYYLTPDGNFEGRNHLVRKSSIDVSDLEEKLLIIRKQRKQPSRDDKILSGLNALAATALIHAGRYLDDISLEDKAVKLVKNIISSFWDGEKLSHSLYKGIRQDHSFLFDAASLLTALSLLYETDQSWKGQLDMINSYVFRFREDGRWVESRTEDFIPVYASWFDHPVPSSVSLVEMALARIELLSGKYSAPKEFREPFQSDFFNLGVMVSNGLFHVITSRENISWNRLPVNSIQVRGLHEQDCYRGVCSHLAL